MSGKSSTGMLILNVARSIAVTVLLTSAAMAEQLTKIELTVSGIDEIIGNLTIAVFASESTFDERADPVAQTLLPVHDETMQWSVDLPSSGSYAIIVYQDLNMNGQIDMTRFGIPIEPYGFSNNARSAFGPPNFRKSRISLDSELVRHQIALR